MKFKYSKGEVLTFLKNLSLVILGTLTLAFGTAIFLLPFELVTGGISGIAIVVEKLLPFEFITVDLLVTVLTWFLFIVGIFVLGKNFALKTLVSTIIYPIGVTLFHKLVSPSVLSGFFYLGSSEHSDIAIILATVFGGFFVGAGCAITFIGGGSTGGVDIIAFTICKIFKKLKSSAVLFAIDAVIITLGMFVIKDFALSLLGIISAFISALVIDKVFLGSSRSFNAQIITDKYEEINREIIDRIDRTTTIVDAVGGYSGKPKKMLIASFTMNQYAEVLNAINKHDKNAFVTIHIAHEINGEGWTR